MLQRSSLYLTLLLALGCNEGHDELMVPDLSAGDDMMSMSTDDMDVADMNAPQCGDIVRCLLLTCGVTNIMCDQTCVTGAQPAAIQAAGALALCAATNCINLDGGLSGGNQLQIFMCLTQKCQSQVAMCPDLFGS